MKKVVNITIGKVIFSIEQDAYTKLDHYLDGIRDFYNHSDDQAEIISDIEISIAEKFQELIKNNQAISEADVEYVIAEMGTIEQLKKFGEDDYEEQKEHAEESKDEYMQFRKLYRDPDNRIVGGVAAGIAAYFGIDPVIIRIIFVISMFFGGFGLLLYLALWMIVPGAETPSQKLAMHGQPVTLERISHYVNHKVKHTKKKSKNPEVNKVLKTTGAVFDQIFQIIGKILSVVYPIIRSIFGIALTLVGVVGVVVLFFAAFSVFFGFGVAWTLPAVVVSAMSVLAIGASSTVFLAAVAVVAVIPLLVLLSLGLSLLAGRNMFSLSSTVFLMIVWGIAIGLVVAYVLAHLPDLQVLIPGAK
jgi:phage shock protein PspC (stress-responsive transcriptional regulator)